MQHDVPQEVLDQYDIGLAQSIEPLTTGWIHRTYKVTTDNDQYILQRLHPVLSSDEIGEDFLAVTRELERLNFPSPRLITSKTGQPLVKGGGLSWRMQTFLEGSTHDTIQSQEMAHSLGRAYGRFHHALKDFDYTFQTTHPLHETDVVIKKFNQTLQDFKDNPLTRNVQSEIELLTSQLPKLLLPNDLPTVVIHGDPKISNILFKDNKVSAIIDLDTCNRKSPLLDLGDAFRSWCGQEEDDPENAFDIDVFRAAWEGYQDGSERLLSHREVALVPQAVMLISLELAARFLTDYFQDSYFGFDEKRYKTRREHNLARAKGQIALYQDIVRKEGEMRGILGD